MSLHWARPADFEAGTFLAVHCFERGVTQQATAPRGTWASRSFSIIDSISVNVPSPDMRAIHMLYPRFAHHVEQDGLRGWVIDGVVLGAPRRTDKGIERELQIHFSPDEDLLPYLIASICCLLAMIALFLIARGGGLGTRQHTLTVLGGLVVLRIALLLTTLYAAGKFMILTDEIGYFNVGRAIFATLDFSQCAYTLGNAVSHGALSLLTGAKSYYSMVFQMQFFNSIVVGSLVVLLIYVVGFQLSRSKWIALTSAFLYVVWPYLNQNVLCYSTKSADYLHLCKT